MRLKRTDLDYGLLSLLNIILRYVLLNRSKQYRDWNAFISNTRKVIVKLSIFFFNMVLMINKFHERVYLSIHCCFSALLTFQSVTTMIAYNVESYRLDA